MLGSFLKSQYLEGEGARHPAGEAFGTQRMFHCLQDEAVLFLTLAVSLLHFHSEKKRNQEFYNVGDG